MAALGVVERLHAHAEAVDAGGPVAAELLRGDGPGVGLHADLGVGRDVVVTGHRVEDAADGGGG